VPARHRAEETSEVVDLSSGVHHACKPAKTGQPREGQQAPMLALILSALAVGLGNLGAAISIGMSGGSRDMQIKLTAVFGPFEVGMPLIGLLLGHSTSRTIGSISGYIGGGLLIAMGLWQIVQRVRGGGEAAGNPPGLWRLILTGFALSMDNLVVGFALGARHVSLAAAIVVFAVVTVALGLLGLEIGRRVSAAVDVGVDYVAAAVLLAVGVLVAIGEF
jgi:putative Mn2+ efflux pump MntP